MCVCVFIRPMHVIESEARVSNGLMKRAPLNSTPHVHIRDRCMGKCPRMCERMCLPSEPSFKTAYQMISH